MGVGPERPEEAMAVGEEATGFIPPPIDENKACFSPTILWMSSEFPGRLVESFVHTFFKKSSVLLLKDVFWLIFWQRSSILLFPIPI